MADVSKQMIGKTDAKGGNFGLIQTRRRFSAMKDEMRRMMVMVEVAMEKRWIIGMLKDVVDRNLRG